MLFTVIWVTPNASGKASVKVAVMVGAAVAPGFAVSVPLSANSIAIGSAAVAVCEVERWPIKTPLTPISQKNDAEATAPVTLMAPTPVKFVPNAIPVIALVQIGRAHV